MKKINAVGFDLDGVLINSLSVMRMAWSQVCEACDIKDISFDSYACLIGLPFDVIIKELGLGDRFQHIKEIYFQETKKNYQLIELYPGSKIVLESLVRSGIPTFIVTSKPRESAESIISNLGIVTDCLVCPEDVNRGKPYKDSANFVREKLSLIDKNVLFVGDMLVDLEFANNANFDFCYANYGYGKISIPRLAQHVKINKIDDLLSCSTPFWFLDLN